MVSVDRRGMHLGNAVRRGEHRAAIDAAARRVVARAVRLVEARDRPMSGRTENWAGLRSGGPGGATSLPQCTLLTRGQLAHWRRASLIGISSGVQRGVGWAAQRQSCPGRPGIGRWDERREQPVKVPAGGTRDVAIVRLEFQQRVVARCRRRAGQRHCRPSLPGCPGFAAPPQRGRAADTGHDDSIVNRSACADSPAAVRQCSTWIAGGRRPVAIVSIVVVVVRVVATVEVGLCRTHIYDLHSICDI